MVFQLLLGVLQPILHLVATPRQQQCPHLRLAVGKCPKFPLLSMLSGADRDLLESVVSIKQFHLALTHGCAQELLNSTVRRKPPTHSGLDVLSQRLVLDNNHVVLVTFGPFVKDNCGKRKPILQEQFVRFAASSQRQFFSPFLWRSSARRLVWRNIVSVNAFQARSKDRVHRDGDMLVLRSHTIHHTASSSDQTTSFQD